MDLTLTDILAQSGINSLADSGHPLNQIDSLLSAIRDTPYSAFVSNLILVLLAIAIVIVGLSAGWIASHPDRFRAFIAWLRGRPVIMCLEADYRWWIEFLVRRFNPGVAYGLSFTIGLLALGLSIWAFGSVLEDVVAQNETVYFDAPIVVHIAYHRIGWLTAVMSYLTLFGNGWFVMSLAVVTGFFLRYRTGNWRPLLLLAATVAGAGILDMIFKVTVARPRPLPEWMAAPAAGYSFPSGHTALSSVYVAVAYLLSRVIGRWQVKVIVWMAAITLAFLIGVSRVYLGVHWPTDVLGGWALAAVWLSIVYTAASVIEQTAARPSAGLLSAGHASSEADASRVSAPLISRRFIPGTGGLTEAEVKERIASGRVNITKQRASRSFVQIFKANMLTRFNALLVGMLIVILLTGSVRDALFGIIIFLNTAIGIVQELRVKRTLDRLALVTASRARVVRSDTLREVTMDQIVIDDIIELRPGDQVPVDGVVLHSNNVEVDETLLTGESEPVSKEGGDEIYSGSFVVAGSCRIQAVRVGEQAYVRRLANAARRFELSHSELREGINSILGYITWFLIPTSLLLFVTQILYMQGGWRDAVAGSVAGVVGMVPEGLVLLASVAMAAAVVRLARRDALIQELAAVEMLARVDVLCLDKTGTLTEGKMVLEKIIPAGDIPGMAAVTPPCKPEDVLGIFAKTEMNHNASLAAIAAICQPPQEDGCSVKGVIPFSSARKWSAVTFDSYGTWVLGAPEAVLAHLEPNSPLWSEVNQLAKNGKRVIALSYTKDQIPYAPGGQFASLPALSPAALIVLGEHLRNEVEQTLRYFKDQGVEVKVISGDNPQTAATIAAAAGVTGAELFQDGRRLPADPDALAALLERYTVFGRVTPEQKRLIITALQRKGHVVAMIGDGVNDVLAIKEADFGIAMGSGTGSSRAIAQLVLLSNNFAILPVVIAEGRRVIANIERTANLFIAKTVYVFALALAVGVAQVPFPFLPRHLTLIGSLTIGMPALLLSLSRNAARARPGFVSRVLRFAVPAGGIAAASTLIAYAVTRQIEPANIGLARTAATFTLMGCGLSILMLLERPVTVWQRLFTAALIIAPVVIIVSPYLRTFFALEFPPLLIWTVIIILSASCFIALRAAMRHLIE